MTRRSLALALVPMVLVACSEKSRDTVVEQPADGIASVETRAVGTPDISVTPVVTTQPVSSRYEDGEDAYRAGRFGDARAIFEGYVASRPENPFGHYMLGLASWKLGDFSGAERALLRSLALDSTNPKTLVNLARVLVDLDRHHEALESARRALALDSSSADARRMIARAFHSLGEVDSAIAAYRQALAADERDVWAMNNLGVLYLDEGEPELALPPLARAVQLRGTAPVFQNNLGMALERTGHYELARQAYSNALSNDSTYVKARTNLERVSSLVADPADSLSLEEQAEVFRIQVGMWKDNVRTIEPEVVPVVDSVPAVDSAPAVDSGSARQ